MSVNINSVGPWYDPTWIGGAAGWIAYWGSQVVLAPYNLSVVSADGFALSVMGAAQLWIQNEYSNLASNYYDLYNDQRQFYYSNFQGGSGFETQFTNQVFFNPLQPNGLAGNVYIPQYADQASVILTQQYNNPNFVADWWKTHANMYGSQQVDGTVAYSRFYSERDEIDYEALIVDSANYLYRYEDHRADVYNERTWEWQNQALNAGVKQASIAQSGLATSFKFLDEASGSLADVFATQANGLATYSSYRTAEAGTSAGLAANANNIRQIVRNQGIPKNHMSTDLLGSIPTNRPAQFRGQPFYVPEKEGKGFGFDDTFGPEF